MSLLTEASARIEGWVEKESQRARAARLYADVMATDWARTFQVAFDTAEWAIANAQDLDEIRAAIAAREAARPDMLAYNEIKSLLEDMKKAPADNIDGPSPDEVAPALSWLNEQMQTLMTAVVDIDRRLGAVKTVHDAIRDDAKIQAWRELEDAVDRYAEIRAAQETLCRRTSVPMIDGPALSEMLARFGILRNPLDHHADIIRIRQGAQEAHRTPQSRGFLEWLEDAPKPAYDWTARGSGMLTTWPDEAQSPLDSRASREASPTAVLRWLATNKAAWVPTFEQMDDIAAEVRAMTAPLHSVNELRFALDAFERYYTARGVKPLKPFDAAIAALPKPRGLRDNRGREGVPRPDPRVLALTGE